MCFILYKGIRCSVSQICSENSAKPREGCIYTLHKNNNALNIQYKLIVFVFLFYHPYKIAAPVIFSSNILYHMEILHLIGQIRLKCNTFL